MNLFVQRRRDLGCGLYLVGVGTRKGAETDPWTLCKVLHDPKETPAMLIQYSGLKCDREREREERERERDTHTFHLVILSE